MHEKICARCKRLLPITEFYQRADRDRPRSKCKECYLLLLREYKRDNSGNVKESSKRYRKENKDVLQVNASHKRYLLRYSIFDRLGRECAHCGFSDYRALCIDHVNGGGATDRRLYPDYRTYLKRISEYSDDDLRSRYQLLCANCNTIKKLEMGEYGEGKTGRWESVRDRLRSADGRSERADIE